MLQSLRRGVDKSGGEGGVVPSDHGVPGNHHAVGGARVRQLAEVGHHIRHGESRIGVQRDGGDLELLIAEAGGVEGLEVEERMGGTGGEQEKRIKKRRWKMENEGNEKSE